MSETAKRVAIKVNGMTCVGCALSVERAVQKMGISDARVNFASKELIIEDSASKSLKEITNAIEDAGFSVFKKEKSAMHLAVEKALLILTGLVSLYFIVAMFFMDIYSNPLLDAILASIVLAIGLGKFGLGAYKSAKSGMANMYVLILLGAITAYLFSFYLWFFQTDAHLYFETTAVIIALVMLGNWVEEISINKTTAALSRLATQQVQDAKLLVNGKVEKVSVNTLKKGDQVQINTGDVFPTDGLVLEGNALADESLLTGESVPVVKTSGVLVFGGSVLNEGNLVYEVSKAAHLSALSKINELVQKASTEKADIQKYADKISAIFVPTIIAIAAVWFLVSYFFMGLTIETSLIRSIAILVVSCPCAMGLATPISVMVGLGKMSKAGILAKSSSTFENFAAIETLLLDKTGTITTGNFSITDFQILEGEEQEITGVIKSLESKSSHPIAVSVAQHFAAAKEVTLLDVEEKKGSGMQAKDNSGNVWKLGNASFTNSLNEIAKDIYLLKNDKLVATFNISDTLKPAVKETLQYFKKQDITSILLSGDNERKVAAVAKELNIEAKGALQPEDKLAEIEKYVSSPTAMIGDGINDAPALSKVNVGITFSEASNITIQNADVVLMQHDIALLAKAHKIAMHTLRTIKQNLFWAFAYNLVAIPLAAFGILSPMLAAFFMLFSDLIVIGNAYLLKLKKI